MLIYVLGEMLKDLNRTKLAIQHAPTMACSRRPDTLVFATTTEIVLNPATIMTTTTTTLKTPLRFKPRRSIHQLTSCTAANLH